MNSMKDDVENGRSFGKVENWVRVCRLRVGLVPFDRKVRVETIGGCGEQPLRIDVEEHGIRGKDNEIRRELVDVGSRKECGGDGNASVAVYFGVTFDRTRT